LIRTYWFECHTGKELYNCTTAKNNEVKQKIKGFFATILGMTSRNERSYLISAFRIMPFSWIYNCTEIENGSFH